MSDPLPLGSALPGVERRFHWDEASGCFALEQRQDVEPILRANAAARAAGGNGFSAERGLRRIASIPVTTLDRWARDDGLPIPWLAMAPEEFATWVKRKLRSPDWRRLRTVDGGI